MRIFALVLGAFALVSATAPNWVVSVRIQPNGAFVMGKPAAPAKLVEYLSYTCGHCAHFTGEASAAPDREAALSNLLNIIGRRQGVRSIITVG